MEEHEVNIPHGWTPMTKDQFNRKYVDTHKGLHCAEVLHKGAYKNSSLIKHSPGDKNITQRGKIKGKNLIEAKCMKDRAEDVKHFFVDAMAVRGKEILNKEDMPFDKLVNAVIKVLPQQVEQTIEANMTFADIIRKASNIRKNEDTIDVEAKVDE